MKITASYLTLAGAMFGQPARYGIAQRSAMAARAGYAGIGALCGEPYAGLPYLAAPVTELEWLDLGTCTTASVSAMATMARTLGTVTRVNAGIGIGQTQSHHSDRWIADRLARYAAMLAPLTVALEPVAFGELWHPSRVCRVIAMAGAANVGMLWDTWHMERARERGARFTVPASIVAEVQLAGYRRHAASAHDASVPAQFTDAMNRSRTDAPAMAQLTHLMASGYAGPVDVEMTNPRMRAMAPEIMAQASYPDMPLRMELGPMPAFLDTPHTWLGLAALGITHQEATS